MNFRLVLTTFALCDAVFGDVFYHYFLLRSTNPGYHDRYIEECIDRNSSYRAAVVQLQTGRYNASVRAQKSQRVKLLREAFYDCSRRLNDTYERLLDLSSTLNVVPYPVLSMRSLVSTNYRYVYPPRLDCDRSRVVRVDVSTPFPPCVSGWSGSGYINRCGLPFFCYDVRENVTVSGNVSVCYGRRPSPFDGVLFSFKQRGFQPNHHENFCNSTHFFSIPTYIIKLFSQFPKNQFVQTFGDYLVFSDGGYSKFFQYFSPVLISNYSVEPYRFICDDNLFQTYGNTYLTINFFPSLRPCTYFVSGVCMDLYRRDVCPSTFVLDDYVTRIPVSYFYVPVRRVPVDRLSLNFTRSSAGSVVDDVFDKLSYVYNFHLVPAVFKFSQYLDYLVAQTDAYFRSDARWYDFFAYEMQYRLEEVGRKLIDYLITNVTMEHEHYSDRRVKRSIASTVGGWFSTLAGKLVEFFWRQFIEILDELIKALLALVVELIPAFEAFLADIESALEKFVELAFTAISLLVRLFLKLLLKIEESYLLSECVVVFVVFDVVFRNRLLSFLLCCAFVIVFGFKRDFTSLLLLVVNSFSVEQLQYKKVYFNDTHDAYLIPGFPEFYIHRDALNHWLECLSSYSMHHNSTNIMFVYGCANKTYTV